MSKLINDKITSQKLAIAFAEKNLLPAILKYWETKSLNGMTVDAKLALQKFWTEYFRPGQLYNVTCSDCPAMGLDSIGTWYCKSFGLTSTVEAIQAGMDGTIDEFAQLNSIKRVAPLTPPAVPPVVETVTGDGTGEPLPPFDPLAPPTVVPPVLEALTSNPARKNTVQTPGPKK
jgi:hypothetical protein